MNTDTIARSVIGTPHARTPRPSSESTVFIVDEDPLVCESLELLIEAQGWHTETFASAEEFLARPRLPGPSCLILDVELPGLSGLELQGRVAIERPDMPVIFLSAYSDVRTGVQAMKAGAIEFLTKPVNDDAILSGVRQAFERSCRVLAHEAKMTALRGSYASLTRREREVMVLVASGLLNKQVAGELGISEITVKAHRGQVMRKMNASSLPALVNMAGSLELAPEVTPQRAQEHP